MSIEFQCGACGKSLKTTDDKAGRRARCPECGEMVVVPSPGGEASEFDFNFEEAALPGGTFNIGPSQVESGFGGTRAQRPRRAEPQEPCPMCGELVGRSAKKCPHCGERLERKASRRSGTGKNRISVDEVFGQAWTAFSDRAGLIIGAMVLAALLLMIVTFAIGVVVGVVFGFSIIAGRRTTMADPLSALGSGFVVIVIVDVFFLLFWDWLLLGLSIIATRITRSDNRAELADLFAGGPQLMRFFGISLLLALILFGAALAGGLISVMSQSVLLPVIVVYGTAFFLLFKFWAAPFVLADQDPGGLRTLGICWEIMTGNHVTMFLTLLMLFLIHFTAFLLPVFGGPIGFWLWLLTLVFTLPFTFLIFASAYDLITTDDYEADYE